MSGSAHCARKGKRGRSHLLLEERRVPRGRVEVGPELDVDDDCVAQRGRLLILVLKSGPAWIVGVGAPVASALGAPAARCIKWPIQMVQSVERRVAHRLAAVSGDAVEGLYACKGERVGWGGG